MKINDVIKEGDIVPFSRKLEAEPKKVSLSDVFTSPEYPIKPEWIEKDKWGATVYTGKDGMSHSLHLDDKQLWRLSKIASGDNVLMQTETGGSVLITNRSDGKLEFRFSDFSTPSEDDISDEMNTIDRDTFISIVAEKKVIKNKELLESNNKIRLKIDLGEDPFGIEKLKEAIRDFNSSFADGNDPEHKMIDEKSFIVHFDKSRDEFIIQFIKNKSRKPSLL